MNGKDVVSMVLKVASFFTGVGGIDIGFEQTGGYETVYANELDKFAVQTFESNFGIQADHRDITSVDVDDIPDFDVMLAGFPCQPFSVAGRREGFSDTGGRGQVYFEVERIFKAKQPEIIFLENVKNLVTHDKGNTFRVIHKSLLDSGYHVKHMVLNGSTHGNIPQNRERIYIVAFKDKAKADLFDFPDKIDLTRTVRDFIDFAGLKDEKYYYRKWKHSFYDELEQHVLDDNHIYQWRRKYVRRNMSGIVPTLTANMGTGGHNVPIIHTKQGIRKMTPRECFNTQGFPDTFVLPEKMSDSQLYKQAGNSVVVPVVNRIAEQLLRVVR